MEQKRPADIFQEFLDYMHFVRSLANMGGGEWHEKRKFHFAEM